ncbi:HECT domain-containing ubiquitin-transferase [Hamiltosporidium tvaerminnensis]|uniref:HECT-type E3 ubiquitin transferase n=2 Tax=Hamiltosporidium TaxID=1176354 RepID=A0A4V2JUN7_9MICR|nr:hypothetical protein LUQ84_001205 [Hamiltosporidium tvaerminnensis]TBU00892.1 HECT domain-containing ubiquitin-transferase [Hamiltosporidium magnivora]TBU01031.1 HECT domain-containing ubiquitin-transferase [Hamiltosporidium tvaerminnensis]
MGINKEGMFLILEKTKLKKDGWFSFLFNYKFQMIINHSNKIESIPLKAKEAHIGYIIKTSENKLKITIKMENKISETYDVNVTDGHIILNIKNEYFYGTIHFFGTKKSIFSELENQMNLASNNINDPFVEQKTMKTDRIYSLQLYNGKVYFVDSLNYKTFWSFTNEFVDTTLPPGWEKKFMKKGRAYYINHNNRTTSWVHPVSEQAITKIENKLHRYYFATRKTDMFFSLNIYRLFIRAKRGFLIQSTASTLVNARIGDLMKNIYIEFIDEIGEDYGALLKEYFYKTSFEIAQDFRMQETEDIFDVKPMTEQNYRNDAYIAPVEIENQRRLCVEYDADDIDSPFFQDSENKGMNYLDDATFFTFVGIFLALAIEHEQNIGINFSLAFYENFLRKKFELSHVQDTQVQSSLAWLLKNDYDLYEDVGREDINSLGKNTAVCRERKDYILTLVYENLYESKALAYEHIRNGFYYVAPPDFEDIFNCYDLVHILHGNESVTSILIKQNLVFMNCDENTKEIVFLLQILDEKNEEYLRNFLCFVTGSGTILFNAIKTGKFAIYIEQSKEEGSLVRASSCINRLYIGQYNSKKEFEQILDFCLYNTEGFHKV